MKALKIIAVASLALSCLVQADDGAKPPQMWEHAFHDQSQLVWDKLRKDDGKVTAKEVIEENYKGGSHHDGDRQLATALSLIQLPDDPIPTLRKMMQEKKPERKAFAVLVAGILGDARLTEDINKLHNDTAALGQFAGDWFWDTVGDAAQAAARSLKEGGVATHMRKSKAPVSPWLKSIKLNAKDGTLTAPEPKTEDKHQPKLESEERSQ